MATVLIVDDDAAMRETLAETIADLGHRPITADGGHAALAIVKRQPVEAVLLDLRMPDLDGLEVLGRLRAISPGRALSIAILTAHAGATNTIEAMRLGAFDHLTKPIGREDLVSLLARMVRTRPSVPSEIGPSDGDDIGEELVGSSGAMREVHKTIGLVADSDATVLLTGETGTGKEVVAGAIHRYGRRVDGPFIAVNCAAIPADLLESELFGHVRGAFTGAIAERRGAFRDADTGTLFLDEIGDMDVAMQAKILRALQERTITPVGGRPVRVDVRIVAATHRDLSERIAGGHFREDLYYRLAVVPIHLPALRDRLADIVPLAEHFLRSAGASQKQLTQQGASRLLAHSWPGNVRELKNAIERAVVLSRGEVIDAADFDFLGEPPPNHAATQDEWTVGDLPSAVARLETQMITRALQETGGNRTEAARRLGIHRQLLYTKAERYGIAIEAPSEDQTTGVGKADACMGVSVKKIN
ncbi:sigma-54-dependent transcriptional regulator [Rhizobium mesoamericanum]|uniref:sigma-54-dependent transcriptional regulator n=1 Tax=Rhizobium mesoamericanum TaxID=1079800 RepID=UPI00040C0A2D|nr:sigma-54 dependent transcriptional regulator [Rhizobium mesoamericanum]